MLPQSETLLMVENAGDVTRPTPKSFEPDASAVETRPAPWITDQAQILPGAETNPAPAVSGTRVMIVEDRADIRNLLRDYLELEGFAVEAWGNATDALDRLAEFRPRVVLLDILMPGLSGISALQQIRARGPEIGIIMVTGNGDEDVAKQTLTLGAFDYITKPVDFDYLKRTIEAFLLTRA